MESGTDEVAIFCIVLGSLIVIGRAPLVVAPRSTLRRARELLFGTNSRVRALGLLMAVLAAALLGIPFGEGLVPALLYGLGWVAAALTLFPFVAPGASRDFATGVLDFVEGAISDGGLRFLGALGTLFGLGLIYFGIRWL